MSEKRWSIIYAIDDNIAYEVGKVAVDSLGDRRYIELFVDNWDTYNGSITSLFPTTTDNWVTASYPYRLNLSEGELDLGTLIGVIHTIAPDVKHFMLDDQVPEFKDLSTDKQTNTITIVIPNDYDNEYHNGREVATEVVAASRYDAVPDVPHVPDVEPKNSIPTFDYDNIALEFEVGKLGVIDLNDYFTDDGALTFTVGYSDDNVLTEWLKIKGDELSVRAANHHNKGGSYEITATDDFGEQTSGIIDIIVNGDNYTRSYDTDDCLVLG